MKRLYYLRHGQSQANVDGVYAGWSDSPLTETGRQQAHQAAEVAKRLQIEKIFSSDLSRALETAEIVADALGMQRNEVIKTRKLREGGVGELAGKEDRGIPGTPNENMPGWDHYSQTKNNSMGVEYIGDLRQRLQDFLDELDMYPEETVLLVGHDVAGLTLREVLLRQYDDVFRQPSFPNGRILRLPEGEIV